MSPPPTLFIFETLVLLILNLESNQACQKIDRDFHSGPVTHSAGDPGLIPG